LVNIVIAKVRGKIKSIYYSPVIHGWSTTPASHFILMTPVLTLGGRVKQVQPFKGFPPFDLGGEFIHGSNTVVNKIAHDNGWVVLPVSQFYPFNN